MAHYLFYPEVKLMDLAQRPMLALISSSLFDCAIVMFLILLVEGKYHQPFWRAIRWNWPKQVFVMLALGAATYLALALLGSLLPMPKETPFDKLLEERRSAYFVALLAITIGPLMEELFFRGVFYPVIAKPWGAGWGVFLSALPFALLHMWQYGYSPDHLWCGVSLRDRAGRDGIGGSELPGSRGLQRCPDADRGRCNPRVYSYAQGFARVPFALNVGVKLRSKDPQKKFQPLPCRRTPNNF